MGVLGLFRATDRPRPREESPEDEKDDDGGDEKRVYLPTSMCLPKMKRK